MFLRFLVWGLAFSGPVKRHRQIHGNDAQVSLSLSVAGFRSLLYNTTKTTSLGFRDPFSENCELNRASPSFRITTFSQNLQKGLNPVMFQGFLIASAASGSGFTMQVLEPHGLPKPQLPALATELNSPLRYRNSRPEGPVNLNIDALLLTNSILGFLIIVIVQPSSSY